MAEKLIFPETKEKRALYESLLPQLKSMLSGESDSIANMANVAAALQEAFHFLWVGFYRVVDDELVLGPFQGAIACTRIVFGKGVCGNAWEKEHTLIVDDVEAFPGHIACSAASRSEIVVPVFQGGHVIAVLDIDSESLASFDSTDKEYLEQIVELLSA